MKRGPDRVARQRVSRGVVVADGAAQAVMAEERRGPGGGRLRPRVTADEQAAIVTLSKRGASQGLISRVTGRDRGTVARVLAGARSLLASRAGTYADLHLDAARVAALKGDARPSEWAMDRLGVVEPRREDAGSGKVQVSIGVVLPGLPGGPVVGAPGARSAVRVVPSGGGVLPSGSGAEG
jgi:hypothetical protein